MTTLEDALGNIEHFLCRLEHGMLEHGLPLALGPMDHLCYRALDDAEYLTLRTALAQFGDVLVEGMIGNRPIITFELFQPLTSPFGPIPCVELAAPKAGKQHLHGLEHGEIVVANLHQLLNDYSWVPFNRTALHNRSPELTLALSPYQIKFHCHSLADTIAHEIASHQVTAVPDDYFAKVRTG